MDGQLAPAVAAVADSGTGAEAQSVLARVSDLDSAAGTDSGYVAGGTTNVSSSDSGTGTDLSASVGVASLLDAAAGTDAGTTTAALSSADSGTGFDFQLVAGHLSDTDSAAGIDSGQLVVLVVSADSGTGTDGQRTPVLMAAPDSATGVDAGFLQPVYVFSSDGGTGFELQSSGGIQYKSGSDSGTGSDAQFVTEILTRPADLVVFAVEVQVTMRVIAPVLVMLVSEQPVPVQPPVWQGPGSYYVRDLDRGSGYETAFVPGVPFHVFSSDSGLGIDSPGMSPASKPADLVMDVTEAEVAPAAGAPVLVLLAGPAG